jgi:NAD(P)-dependent dehydrogenase (short-subunit alcohol dehydrogenase family)
MSDNEFDLSGKVALVAGGGRGLGKNIALRLAEYGADVVVAARTKAQVEQTAAQIKAMGRKSLAIVADVANTEQTDKMVETTLKSFPRIDILAVIAGYSVRKPLVPLDKDPPTYLNEYNLPKDISNLKLGAGITDEEWVAVTNTNVLGVVRCCRAVGSQMIKQKSGKVLILGSGVGITGNEILHTPYATTKAAINNFARALALEWNPYNIQVNVMTPGNIGKISAEVEDPGNKQVAWGGNSRQVGLLAVFLASPASNFISGQTISCNTRGRMAQP